MSLPTTENSLYYEDTVHDQNTVNYVINTFSKLRDFHNDPGRLFPFIIFANEAAKVLNLSLTVISLQNFNIHNRGAPTLLTNLGYPATEIQTPFHYWQLYKNYSSSYDAYNKPVFIERYSYPLNLAYCDFTTFEHESPVDLSLFTSPFNTWVWLFIFLAMTLVTFILPFEHGNKFQTSLQFIIYNLFLTFSALLSPSTGLSFKKAHQRSIVLVLWMLTSMVIVNFYSGVISSQIVKPNHPVIIKNADELFSKKYTLLYQLETHKEFVKSIAMSRNFSILLSLAKSAEVKGDEILNELAFENKKAIIMTWPAVSRWVNMAKNLIKAKSPTKHYKHSKFRDCYLGKELISSGMNFYGLLPPKHGKLSKVIQKLFESGIYRYWLDEYFGLAKAGRVQDRVKIKSPTKVLVETFTDGNIEPPLNIHGKMLKVFVLYSICILVCCFLQLCELLRQKLF